MYKLVTQKHSLGCGVACLASLLDQEYDTIILLLQDNNICAIEKGLYCKDIVRLLRQIGYDNVTFKYVKKKIHQHIYIPGTIVFIKRSQKYPNGHYLLRTSVGWMDSWLNVQSSDTVMGAKSGIRKRVPGTPVYAIFPHGLR